MASDYVTNAFDLIYAGRAEEADKVLRERGFSVRLSTDTFLCKRHVSPNEPSGIRPCVVLEHVFPPPILDRLVRVFRIGGPFWTEHDYANAGYFS